MPSLISPILPPAADCSTETKHQAPGKRGFISPTQTRLDSLIQIPQGLVGFPPKVLQDCGLNLIEVFGVFFNPHVIIQIFLDGYMALVITSHLCSQCVAPISRPKATATVLSISNLGFVTCPLKDIVEALGVGKFSF